mgnify:CR=1 FL=1
MKFKTTKKAIMNGYKNIISVGNDNLQRMLSCENAIAYTIRREGWGADIYNFGNTAIVTGYSPFGNVKANYELCKRYEDEAASICKATYEWNVRKAQLDNLINRFISEVTREEA